VHSEGALSATEVAVALDLNIFPAGKNEGIVFGLGLTPLCRHVLTGNHEACTALLSTCRICLDQSPLTQGEVLLPGKLHIFLWTLHSSAAEMFAIMTGRLCLSLAVLTAAFS